MAKVKDDDFSMAKEYIEREAFKRHIQAISHSPNDQFSAGSVINLINKAPAVDVVSVVRCKDCFHFKTDSDYCVGCSDNSSCGYCCEIGRCVGTDFYCKHGAKMDMEIDNEQKS